MHRAEAQWRREGQNQDVGALSCAKPVQGIGSKWFLVFTGEAGHAVKRSAKKSGFLCASASLRENKVLGVANMAPHTIGRRRRTTVRYAVLNVGCSMFRF